VFFYHFSLFQEAKKPIASNPALAAPNPF